MSMHRLRQASLAWLATATIAHAAETPAKSRLTAEEVIARHLESIGTAAAREAAGGRVVKGQVHYVRKPVSNKDSDPFAARTTDITVPMTVASGGPRYRIDLQYGSKEYPFDRIIYDGKRVKNARALAPGNYTVLVGLLHDNPFLLKAGLIGGPLTTAWALLSAGERFEKLDYAGLKKLDGKPVHRVNARLKSESGHEISFSFDPESFQLLRTSIWIAPNGRRKLEQDFSDYRLVHGLTLPHAWKMVLDAPEDTWQLSVTEVHVASELPEEAFQTD